MEWYVDAEGKVHKYIYYLDKPTNDWPIGWYFSDETEGFNGPYNSLEETEETFNSYCEWLNGEK